MMEEVNKILGKLEILNYKILPNFKFKKKNSKKIQEIQEIYKENIDYFHEYSLTQFDKLVREIKIQENLTQNIGLTSIQDLLNQCDFVYKKFKWFVTPEKIKVYYLKTHPYAEQYLYLTTDRESVKFFNSLELSELQVINDLIFQYNMMNVEDPLDEEKLMKIIIGDIRRKPQFCLAKEPVTLTNDHTEPAFKFFDINAIDVWGYDYYAANKGHRIPTPAWDGFFARIREQNMVPLVKAYLAGLFVAKNSTKQALYVFGNGNDGKSQLTNVLATEMGREITFALPQNMRSNQFTLMDAYGKRMFLGEELQSPNVIKTGMLHAILGGSYVRLEPKGEASFTGKVYACGVITSNYAPQLEDVKNQISRLLYIEMNPTTDEEINRAGEAWSRDLHKEFPAMLWDGYQHYKELNPSGASFKMPKNYRDTLSDLFDDKSKHINAFIDDVFISDKESHILSHISEAFIYFVKDHYFDENDLSVPVDYRDNKTVKEIFEKLLIKFPHILRVRKTIDGKKLSLITGLSISQNDQAIMRIFKAK